MGFMPPTSPLTWPCAWPSLILYSFAMLASELNCAARCAVVAKRRTLLESIMVNLLIQLRVS